MKVDYFMKGSPLKKESEDAFFINKKMNIYGVCDGATPVASFQDGNGHNGAYLAANLLKRYFEETEEEDLRTGIREANRILHNAMLQHNVDVTQKHHLWCSCIAVIRITQTELYYAQLGDSMIVVQYKNGTIRVLTKDTVKGIGERARLKREEERKQGIVLPDESYFANIKHRLIYNRSLANVPNGYTVANGTEEAGKYIQFGEEAIENITNIFICSDGLFHPDIKLEDTASFIWNQGIEAYVQQLEEIERQRGLRLDDKTAVVITL
jgi:serine/threonine protein phosphatase PrpC